jgi:hypothetical protein
MPQAVERFTSDRHGVAVHGQIVEAPDGGLALTAILSKDVRLVIDDKQRLYVALFFFMIRYRYTPSADGQSAAAGAFFIRGVVRKSVDTAVSGNI